MPKVNRFSVGDFVYLTVLAPVRMALSIGWTTRGEVLQCEGRTGKVAVRFGTDHGPTYVEPHWLRKG